MPISDSTRRCCCSLPLHHREVSDWLWRPYASVRKECQMTPKERWYKKNREKVVQKARDLRRTRPRHIAETVVKSIYGLLPDEFYSLLISQQGRCAICNDPLYPGPHIDHDHTTGAVRGLLCRLCNKGIGLLRDDPRIIEAALSYLRGSVCNGMRSTST